MRGARSFAATLGSVLAWLAGLVGVLGLLLSGDGPQAATLAGAPPAPVVPAASHAPMPERCAGSRECTEVLTTPAIFTTPSVRSRLFAAAGSSASGPGGQGEGFAGAPSNTTVGRPVSSTASATTRSAVTSGCSATGVLGLRRWKLTLPAGDSESPTEILPGELGTVSSTFFRPTDRCDGVTFRAPVTGATTKGSNYPRSELRELNADGSPAAWSSSSGTHSIAVREAFTALPQGKPQLVGLQIHDADDDVSVFRLEGSKLYVTNGDDPHYQLIDPDYRLGTVFTAAYLVTDDTIWAYYNSRPVAKLSKRFDGAYFKAGAYTQANCSNSSPCQDSNAGETVIHALRVRHD